MDVYTGRVMSHDEAELRLEQVPETRRAPIFARHINFVRHTSRRICKNSSPGARSQRSIRSQRQADKGQMTNPLTGLVEPRCYVKSYGCDGGVDYGHLDYDAFGDSCFLRQTY